MKTMAAALTSTFLALCLQAGSALAEDALFSATPLQEHLLMIQGPAGNTLVGIDADGLVLVDGVPAAQAEAYLDFVRAETGVDRVKTLINSHWHHERTGLNELLGREDVRIVAHENTRLWLGSTIRRRGDEILHTPLPAHALPNQTFYQSESLPFRGGSIEFGYLLQAHTDGDLYAYFPAANVLYAGDVLRSDGWAAVDESTNGFIGGLMDAFAELAGIVDENTVIVPASGPLMSKADFDAQHAMYKGLISEMVALLRESKSAEEVVAIDPASSLRPEWGSAADFLEQGFRSFYGHLRDSRHVGSMP